MKPLYEAYGQQRTRQASLQDARGEIWSTGHQEGSLEKDFPFREDKFWPIVPPARRLKSINPQLIFHLVEMKFGCRKSFHSKEVTALSLYLFSENNLTGSSSAPDNKPCFCQVLSSIVTCNGTQWPHRTFLLCCLSNVFQEKMKVHMSVFVFLNSSHNSGNYDDFLQVLLTQKLKLFQTNVCSFLKCIYLVL